MLSEKTNRPILRKSISFAGVTKHSRTTRGLRNRRFKHQTREAPSLLKDNPHFHSHPYKIQKENMSIPQRELRKKALFKNHRRFSREFDTGDMRILDDADLSGDDRLISVLGIADRMKHSLNIEKEDKMTNEVEKIKYCTHPLKNQPLKRHNSENMEMRRKENQVASQPNIETTRHQIQFHHVNDAKSDVDDKIISMPCLGEDIFCTVGDSTEKTTVLPSVTSDSGNEKFQHADAESYKDRTKENRSPNVGIDIHKDLEDQPCKLKIKRLSGLEDIDQDFTFSILFSPKSISFSTPSDKKEEDKGIEDLQCFGNTTDIAPDLRDLLCIESPTQNPDANRRLTSDDYRQALTVQDQCTCLFCGSNLEISPFDNLFFTPTYPNSTYDCWYDPDDSHNCDVSPYDFNCNDLTMFCPICRENRLVQNYSSMNNC